MSRLLPTPTVSSPAHPVRGVLCQEAAPFPLKSHIHLKSFVYTSNKDYPGNLETIPLFVILPGERGAAKETVASHQDIAPTVAFLLGDTPDPA